MGDSFEVIVDLDATAADASGLASRALDWLVREGIVRAERTDCVFGEPLGYPPGQQWAKAVTGPGRMPPDGLRMPTDGLSIVTARTVFNGGQGDAQYATCPRCASRTWFYTEGWERIEGAAEAFINAVKEWDASGAATVACPSCAQASEITRWRWEGDYFALGYLGFEFWNWWHLDPRFIAGLSRALNDHQVVRVPGKI